MSITTGSFGTAFSDGVRVGKIQDAQYQYGVPGIRQAPIYTYLIQPKVIAANAVALTQTPALAGYLTLTPNTVVTTSATVQGQTVVALDYPRTLSVTGSGGTVAAANYFVAGYDIYNQYMVDEIIHPGGAVTVSGNKAFKYVSQIYVSAGTTAAITVGVNDEFGLPYAAFAEDVIMSTQNDVMNLIAGYSNAMVAGTTTVLNNYVRPQQTILLQHTGAGVLANYGSLFQGVVVAGTSFVITSSVATDTDVIDYIAPDAFPVIDADVTPIATSTTGDVRGLFGVRFPSDGTMYLSITFYVFGADPEFNLNNPVYPTNSQSAFNLFGAPQNIHGGPF